MDVFSQKGLQERLVMTGKQMGTELADVYNAMDLFVFTSKSETQGMVLAEAIQTEWDLLAEKARAMAGAVTENVKERSF